MDDDQRRSDESSDTQAGSAWRRYVASGGMDDVAGFQIAAILIVAVRGLSFLAHTIIGDHDGVIREIFNIIAVLTALLVQRFTGRLDFGVDLLAAGLFVSTCAQIYFSGGLFEQPSYRLLVVPVLTLGLGFRRRAIFWFIAACACVCVLYLMERGGHEFPSDGLSPAAKQTVQAFTLVFFFCAAFVAFYLVETSRRRVIPALNSANKELSVARDAALAAAQAKTEFVNNISHELRTPLNGIIGTTDLLWHGSLSADQLHLVAILHESEQSLLALVNSLLDYAKLEDGRVTLTPTPTDPGEILENIASLFAVNAADKGVALACRVSPDVPAQVLIDPEAIRQVLSNLLHNALKWTDEGMVTLHVYCAESVSDMDANLVWEVCDTGAGIPADQQEAIFAPFEQVDSSLTRPHGGTGLGLAICRRLAGLMAARLEVESTEGEGSCFRLAGPAKLVPQSSADPVSTERLFGKTVYVAERLELSYAAIRDVLIGLGARAVRLSDPIKQRLSQALDEQTLLVVSDNMLDGLNQETVDGLLSYGCPVVLIAGPSGMALASHPRLQLVRAPARRADLRAALLGLSAVKQAPATAAPQAFPQLDMNVLAAEDNIRNQVVLREILSMFGCRVNFANDGAEAVAKWREAPYDLIFMDCQMPQVDGFSATREIRAAEQAADRPRTPIIGLTGNVWEESRNECLAAGMDDYLGKPFRIKELLDVMKKHVHLH